MGNRVHLILQSNVIFESNNSLPHFWMMLLRPEHVESVRESFRRAYAGEDGNTDIRVEVTDARMLANERRDSLGVLHPSLLPLYDEWLQYLFAQPSDGYIYIDLVQLAGFYDSTDQCIDQLKDTINKIDRKTAMFDPLIAQTTGWEAVGRSSFNSASPAYRMQLEKERSPAEKPASTSLKVMYWLWGLICLVLLGGGFYLFTLATVFWMYLLILILFLPLIYVMLKGFLILEKWFLK